MYNDISSVRTEQQMLDLILATARADERIRAVILNGSRANPHAPHDRFQDFDIVYLVTDVAPFRHNLAWIARFGELMILQMPDAMGDPPPSDREGFAYLMQFSDGNRLDLTIYPLARLAERRRDSLSVLLLDKDGSVPPFPPPHEGDYIPTPPTARMFADCCNEFWWCCPYVAKGLWRAEITYALYVQEHYVREELMKMLNWAVGVQTAFGRNPGKFGKYLQRDLAPQEWALLLATYANSQPESLWQALFAACELFRLAALRVAAHFDFDYPHGDDERVSAYLRHVRQLPRDASQNS